MSKGHRNRRLVNITFKQDYFNLGPIFTNISKHPISIKKQAIFKHPSKSADPVKRNKITKWWLVFMTNSRHYGDRCGEFLLGHVTLLNMIGSTCLTLQSRSCLALRLDKSVSDLPQAEEMFVPHRDLHI